MVQNVFTIAKVGGHRGAGGPGRRQRQGLGRATSGPSPRRRPRPGRVKIGLFAALGVAMSKALFAYDAWNSVTFAAEEMREPETQPAARARPGHPRRHGSSTARRWRSTCTWCRSARCRASRTTASPPRPRSGCWAAPGPAFIADRHPDLDLRLRERADPGRRARRSTPWPATALFFPAHGRACIPCYRTPARALRAAGRWWPPCSP